MIHLDTSFLVDLMREQRRGEGGPASRFLTDHLANETLAVSVHAVCELLAGAEGAENPVAERRRVAATLESVSVVSPDPVRFPPRYARLLRDLVERGERIGTMDLLIATAAVLGGSPLLTGNVRHFERIADLDLISHL